MDVFGSSGVRGVAGEELTPTDAVRIAQATGTVLDTDRVAVARDTRYTGELFVDAAASGLASVGCDVDRLGILPTPGLQYYCESAGVPGVMVTASHNPPEFNGIKLIGDSGVELTRETIEQVERELETEPTLASWDETGRSQQLSGTRRRYREQLLAAVDRERISDANLTVALDPGHGAGALTSPSFFADLGCTVKTVNAQPDGQFPGRNPEPVEESLSNLRRLVRATDADLGIAHDGDGDRAIFVDENGEHISGEATFAALVAAELARRDDMGEQTVVSAVNASQRVVDVVDRAGGTLSLTAIGSTYLITRIQELAAAGETVAVAGEGNGGILFPAYRVARDGAYTGARFLELLCERSASDLIAEYDGYHTVRHNLGYRDETERDAMVEAIERTARESDASVTDIDGYRLDYGDGWVLARPSGTEPVVRVYAEARSAERAEELAAWMRERVGAARA